MNADINVDLFDLETPSRRSYDELKLKWDFCYRNYDQNTIFFKGVKYWNNLSLSVRSSSKLSGFKTSLMDFMRQ